MHTIRIVKIGVLAATTVLLLAGLGASVGGSTQAAPATAEEAGTIVTTGRAAIPAEATGFTSTVTIVVTERVTSKEGMPAAFAAARDKTAQIRGQLLGSGTGITTAQIRVTDPQVSSGSSLIGPGGIPIPIPAFPPGIPGGPTPTPTPLPGTPPVPAGFPATVTQRMQVDATGSQVEPVVITAQNAGAANVSSAPRPPSSGEQPAPAALAEAVRQATEQAHGLAPAAAAASQRGLGFMRKVEVHEPVLAAEPRFGGGQASWSVRVTVTYEMAK